MGELKWRRGPAAAAPATKDGDGNMHRTWEKTRTLDEMTDVAKTWQRLGKDMFLYRRIGDCDGYGQAPATVRASKPFTEEAALPIGRR